MDIARKCVCVCVLRKVKTIEATIHILLYSTKFKDKADIVQILATYYK